MQKIQKFQFGHIYRAPKSTKTYELLDRSGHQTFPAPSKKSCSLTESASVQIPCSLIVKSSNE